MSISWTYSRKFYYSIIPAFPSRAKVFISRGKYPTSKRLPTIGNKLFAILASLRSFNHWSSKVDKVY